MKYTHAGIFLLGWAKDVCYIDAFGTIPLGVSGLVAQKLVSCNIAELYLSFDRAAYNEKVH